MKGLEYIKVEKTDRTCLVSFNRPDCYNAMNRSMKLEIIKALKEAGKDQDVLVVILTGEGKAFSSGQDLNDRTVQSGNGPIDLGYTLQTEWNPLIEAIRGCPKVVIGAINGVCAGAGLSVALACDLKVARPQVKFVSGFAQIGLAPDAGTSFTLTRALGYSRALAFSLMGEPLFSEEMLEAGLINQIADNPLEVSKAWAQKISGLPPLSVKLIKRNLLLAQERGFREMIERETSSQRFLGNSQDYAEGVKAFFEKRKPVFKGK